LEISRETVTLDHLSQGRLTLSVGLGEPAQAEFAHFREEADPKTRAKKLDEGLQLLAGLWSGKTFAFHNEHFQLEKTVFRPPSFQSTRIPIWVGGVWPNKAPFRRAARWDGALPLFSGKDMKVKDLQEILAYIEQHRESIEPFDLVMMGCTPGDNREKAAKIIRPYMAAGLSWWLESLFQAKNSFAHLLTRIRQGPPS
jgi:alkanesulfonate monooxygenase SsuD/methylene tetrahydromethanopterin reductase-like flavin-dependent oxidoreductase (luciferase family)